MTRIIFCGLMLLILSSGCASSDRMVRMSGGILDEYSAPKSSRIRSEKYQKISRELASSTRSNKIRVAGLDDTLINIWPFFFRSNDYWTVMWPLVDKDPYGFAFRPFYNQEGDDYSILFPLTAWNTAAGHGWVTLFGWNRNGFGMVPLTWQWKEKYSGGAYYTPLFIYAYDDEPLHYKPYTGNNGWVITDRKWGCDAVSRFAFFTYYGKHIRKEMGEYTWLFNGNYNWETTKNVWNYRFNGKIPYPDSELAYRQYAAKVFESLPVITRKSYGLLPFWYGSFADDGSSRNRFMLLAGNEKRGDKYFAFDILGDAVAGYEREEEDFISDRRYKSQTSFTSWLLLSHFEKKMRYLSGGDWDKFDRLYSLCSSSGTFSQDKPAIMDALKALDPSLKSPDTVVDHRTLRLYVDELSKNYRFPVTPEYSGRILPLVWYDRKKDRSWCVLPVLLTWWDRDERRNVANFTSLPLLTWLERSPREDKTVVMTPLVYYAKEKHRERSNYPILPRREHAAGEYNCVEIRDRYAACGLFYRGRFGFNVAKEGVDAKLVDKLRVELQNLHIVYRQLENEAQQIAGERTLNDRWQVTSEIERLKKLIRYEELKIRLGKLLEKRVKYRKDVENAMKDAQLAGFPVRPEAFEKQEAAEKALAELMEKYTELRFYEDIGSGLFFNKKKYYNGDYNWHFLHILAGGEKRNERESQHILHLLYRYRKEGQRSETIIFPFISSVQDGEDSKVSFLWRVFSLSKRNGKTGGYIFFIPFGETE
ncbi:MAG: hypothetical protein J6S43_00980 [Lentisphaeria bacterium]|nr:hypothetical protein [Lentisphaeria bacterium]